MIDQNRQRPALLQLPIHVRVRLEALATLMQLPSPSIIERSLQALLDTMSRDDRNIVERMTRRALENFGERLEVGASNLVNARTVKGNPFKYSGSPQTELEVFFENSPSLKISAESIRHIRQEISGRTGPILMGACLKPLVADSLGESIFRKYKLSPIHLSYVIPLLEAEGFCTTRKEGRNWLVESARRTK